MYEELTSPFAAARLAYRVGTDTGPMRFPNRRHAYEKKAYEANKWQTLLENHGSMAREKGSQCQDFSAINQFLRKVLL